LKIKFFNESIIETSKNIKKIQNVLLKNNFLGPLNLSGINENFKNWLLFCITEQKTKTEIDRLTKDFSESVEINKNRKMNIEIFEDLVTSLKFQKSRMLCCRYPDCLIKSFLDLQASILQAKQVHRVSFE